MSLEGPRGDPRPGIPPQSPRLVGRGAANNPRFRAARARLGAFALHQKRPEIAREAGRKGGEATSQRFALGPKAWGVAMAMRRWHKTDFPNLESRAPRAGSGDDGGGAPEPGPAPALRTPRTVGTKTRRGGVQQGQLL